MASRHIHRGETLCNSWSSEPGRATPLSGERTGVNFTIERTGVNFTMSPGLRRTQTLVRRSLRRALSSATSGLVDCSRVVVHPDAFGGAGAYAAQDMKKGDIVERGIVRVLTNVDGNENPYVFTWSDTIPNTTWALGSGCSTFYNTAEEDVANTHMERDFEANAFVITATKDIAAGDQLLHVYKSKGWRKCFQTL